MKKILFLALIVISLVWLVAAPGCSSTGEPDYAGAITENILQSLSNNDYQGYVKDFDPQMKAATTQAAFNQLYGLISNACGQYQSKTFAKTEKQGDFITVIYAAKFTEEPEVAVNITFSLASGNPLVSGLYFDSPKLRQAVPSTTPVPEPAYAADIVESILQAINNDDYSGYIKYFDAAAQAQVTDAAFEQLVSMLKAKIGDYESKTFLQAVEQSGLVFVFYQAKYSLEDGVTVKAAFSDNNGVVEVSGFTLDSPKLRGQ